MRDSKETYKVISETFCNIANGRELLNEIDFAKGPNEDELRRLFDLTDWEGPAQSRPLGHTPNYGVEGDPKTWNKEARRLFRSREKTAKEAGIFDRGDGLDLELTDDAPKGSSSKGNGTKEADAFRKPSQEEMDDILKKFNKERSRILRANPKAFGSPDLERKSGIPDLERNRVDHWRNLDDPGLAHRERALRRTKSDRLDIKRAERMRDKIIDKIRNDPELQRIRDMSKGPPVDRLKGGFTQTVTPVPEGPVTSGSFIATPKGTPPTSGIRSVAKKAAKAAGKALPVVGAGVSGVITGRDVALSSDMYGADETDYAQDLKSGRTPVRAILDPLNRSGVGERIGVVAGNIGRHLQGIGKDFSSNLKYGTVPAVGLAALDYMETPFAALRGRPGEGKRADAVTPTSSMEHPDAIAQGRPLTLADRRRLSAKRMGAGTREIEAKGGWLSQAAHPDIVRPTRKSSKNRSPFK